LIRSAFLTAIVVFWDYDVPAFHCGLANKQAGLGIVLSVLPHDLVENPVVDTLHQPGHHVLKRRSIVAAIVIIGCDGVTEDTGRWVISCITGSLFPASQRILLGLGVYFEVGEIGF
jgi:hypothetical protein